MDNKPTTKSTEQWKVATKRNNCQSGNNKKNGNKPKDSPVNGKIGKKFVRNVDTSTLKGKEITAEGENSATQFKDLVEASKLQFSAVNVKAGKAIGTLINLSQTAFTHKKKKTQRGIYQP